MVVSADKEPTQVLGESRECHLNDLLPARYPCGTVMQVNML